MNDSERLIELLKAKYDHYCDQCGVNKQSDYIENLADYLIANGVTVQKHGRWIQEGNAVYMWRHNCSLCGDPVYNKIKPYNYCPNCGAKMDEETPDDTD